MSGSFCILDLSAFLREKFQNLSSNSCRENVSLQEHMKFISLSFETSLRIWINSQNFMRKFSNFFLFRSKFGFIRNFIENFFWPYERWDFSLSNHVSHVYLILGKSDCIWPIRTLLSTWKIGFEFTIRFSIYSFIWSIIDTYRRKWSKYLSLFNWA